MATIAEVILELRRAAAVVGPDAQVILQEDSEGNSYSTTHKDTCIQYVYPEEVLQKAFKSKDWAKVLKNKEIGVVLCPHVDHLETPESAVELGKELK